MKKIIKKEISKSVSRVLSFKIAIYLG